MTRSLTVPGPGPNRPQPSRWIPVPDLPGYPVLSWAGLLGPAGAAYPNVLDAGPAVYVKMARYAISLALRAMGLGAGDKVLVPGFHCTSMVSPIVHEQGEPVFYRLRPDLTVDLEDVADKTDARTRVLIAAHYFGFHQNITALREFCNTRKLYLIEDCAHAFFGQVDGKPLGSFGDYAITSLWKFFPVPDGGCLVSSAHPLDRISLRRQGGAAELRTFLTALDQANYYARLTSLRPLALGVELAGKAVRSVKRPRDSEDRAGATQAADAGPEHEIEQEFDPAEISIGMTRFCRGVARRMARRGGDIAARRRYNYARLLEGFSGVPACRPLFEELPEDVVPFMFPLLIEGLASAFARLEDAAIPMQRFGQFLWPGVDETHCGVSARLSKDLIQLPCHQDLEEGDIDWLIASVSKLVRT